MRAIVVEKPGQFEMTKVAEPVPGPGEILLRVSCCGICGTDLHIVDGEFPPTPYPITPGHEFSGEVVAFGPDGAEGIPGAPQFREGSLVAVDPSLFCGHCQPCRNGRGNLCEQWGAIGDTVDGAFAEFVTVPVANAYLLPDGFDGQTGAMVEPLACAVHGLERLGPVVSRRVVLFGAGTMGLLLLQLLVRAGAAGVTVVDRAPSRLAVATQLGAVATATSPDQLDGARFDVAVDATGVPAAIEAALGLLDRGSRMLVFGVAPAEAAVPVSPFRIYNDEITITGSMAVLYSFDQAVDLMARGAVDVRPLLSAPMPLEQFDQALKRVRAGEGVKTHIKP
ncbi:MAG TPA: zinc-dependent alcohol dehydrogenase family protein [Acidimicrobiales bacterium]|nr:zinc-dependent alcohol dehydrogenase family protein [Acidimicrobiales bacterium]